eukprot:c36630_g1_i1.p1 GENE.c36630_g1_i1~~c36630_g1_i1.p1  ORF type:complete len:113 (+),score=21.32 c36630_g1_i1:110-448(+)
MQFFKSVIAISAMLMLSVAAVPSHSAVSSFTSASVAGTECDKESETDCTEFCKASEQQATCVAKGDKITCYCKGGKSGESNCEERCVFCMPDKMAFEEAKSVAKFGGLKMEL